MTSLIGSSDEWQEILCENIDYLWLFGKKEVHLRLEK